MKQILSLIITIVLSLTFTATAQAIDIIGQWKGNLAVGQQAVPVIFNVKEIEGSLSATMDSPMQGAKDIPVESVKVSKNEVVFNIKVAAARFEASFIDGQLVGSWKQSGQSFPLSMSKGKIAEIKKK